MSEEISGAGLKQELREIRLKILYLDIMIAWLLLTILVLSWEVADA